MTGSKMPQQNQPIAFEFFVNEADSVLAVKDRIAAARFIAFPDRYLVFGGNTLEDKNRILDYGIDDGASVDFVVRASEAILIEQLSHLLKTKPLSCDDLCFSYCYKYGTAVSKALEFLGVNEQFQAFLKRQDKH